MQKLTKKDKEKLYVYGGINYYSIIEIIMFCDRMLKDVANEINTPAPNHDNIDYNACHDINGFEPGYF